MQSRRRLFLTRGKRAKILFFLHSPFFHTFYKKKNLPIILITLRGDVALSSDINLSKNTFDPNKKIIKAALCSLKTGFTVNYKEADPASIWP